MIRDGVARRSPLGPVIGGIFMFELKKNILLQLSHCMATWKRYVDDTNVYYKPYPVDYLL